MNLFHTSRRLLLTVVFAVVAVGASAQTQTQPSRSNRNRASPERTSSGCPRRSRWWTRCSTWRRSRPQDYVIDLGSGDGRTVITAAKRGATAHGIEYNPDMVALSQRNATAQGVTGKATFAKADLFETDFSKATVITMFLLPSINMQLRPKLLDMKPGTRIVSNAFDMEDWQPDETGTTPNCTQWCKAMLWIVPAKAGGTWKLPQGDLTVTQNFQMLSGTLGSTPITNGKLRGDQVTFEAGSTRYTGRVNGDTIEGTMTAGGNTSNFKASRSSR